MTQPEVLSNQFGTISWHMGSNRGPLTQGNKLLIAKFQKDSNAFLMDLNNFYAEDWAKFEEYVLSLDLKFFPEIKELEKM